MKSIITILLTYKSKFTERNEQKKSNKPDKNKKDSTIDNANNKRLRFKYIYELCGKWGYTEEDYRIKKYYENNLKDNKDSNSKDNKSKDIFKLNGRRHIIAKTRNIDIELVRNIISGNKTSSPELKEQ